MFSSCLRKSSLRPSLVNRIVSSSSAKNFFWSSPEVAKPPPPPEQQPSSASGVADDTDTVITGDLTKHVAEAHSLSQAESRRIINSIFDMIKESVADKKVVKIGGFGTFFSATSKATTARNPRTGEKIDVPEKERVKFRPYNEFKKSVLSE